MTRPPDTSPHPDDTALIVLQRHLTWLRYWLPTTLGPLVAEPALRELDGADEALEELRRDHERTTDLLLEATRWRAA